jgi:hypothetical protein
LINGVGGRIFSHCSFLREITSNQEMDLDNPIEFYTDALTGFGMDTFGQIAQHNAGLNGAN